MKKDPPPPLGNPRPSTPLSSGWKLLHRHAQHAGPSSQMQWTRSPICCIYRPFLTPSPSVPRDRKIITKACRLLVTIGDSPLSRFCSSVWLDPLLYYIHAPPPPSQTLPSLPLAICGKRQKTSFAPLQRCPIQPVPDGQRVFSVSRPRSCSLGPSLAWRHKDDHRRQSYGGAENAIATVVKKRVRHRVCGNLCVHPFTWGEATRTVYEMQLSSPEPPNPPSQMNWQGGESSHTGTHAFSTSEKPSNARRLKRFIEKSL